MRIDCEPQSELVEQRDSKILRLRIHHFLLWITLTALQLTFAQFLARWSNREPAEDVSMMRSAWEVLTVALRTGLYAVALCAVWWRIRGRLQSLEPGEWVAVMAALIAISLSADSIFLLLGHRFESGRITYTDWTPLFSGITDLVLISLCAALIVRGKISWLWKTAFAAMLYHLLDGCTFAIMTYFSDMSPYMRIYSWVSAIGFGLLSITLIGAMVVDLIERRRLRWTHWVGGTFFVFPLPYYTIVALLALLTT